MSTPRQIVYMPLSTLVLADRNAKRHNEKGVAASMSAFGYVEPQLIDERTGKLIAGHGRLKALHLLRDAGAEPPEGVLIAEEGGEWIVPVVHGWASKDDREADAVGVALNQQTIVGGFDERELSAILKSIEDFDHEALGFGELEWDAHMAAFEILDGRAPAEPKPIDPDAMYTECPNCQHRFVP